MGLPERPKRKMINGLWINLFLLALTGLVTLYTAAQGVGSYYALGFVTLCYYFAVQFFFREALTIDPLTTAEAPKNFRIFGRTFEVYAFRPKYRKISVLQRLTVPSLFLALILAIGFMSHSVENYFYWRVSILVSAASLAIGICSSFWGVLFRGKRYFNIFSVYFAVIFFIFTCFFQRLAEPVFLEKPLQLWIFCLAATVLLATLLSKNKSVKQNLSAILIIGPFLFFTIIHDLNIFFDFSSPERGTAKVVAVFRRRGQTIDVELPDQQIRFLPLGSVRGYYWAQVNDVLSYNTYPGFLGLKYLASFEPVIPQEQNPDIDWTPFAWGFGLLGLVLLTPILYRQCGYCDRWFARCRLKCPKCGKLIKITHPVRRRIYFSKRTQGVRR